MNATLSTAIIIIVYFLILLAIGYASSKKIKNAADFIVAGRGLGFWVFVLLIMSVTASGMSVLGVAGLGYTGGWPTFWEQIFVPLSCSVCLIVFGVKLNVLSQTRNYLTVEDYLCDRYYDSKSMRWVSASAALIVSLIYLTGQYTAINIVLKWLLNLNEITSLVVSALIVMSYTLMGGLYAVAFTSMFLGILIIAGVGIICPMIISHAPDFNATLHTINPAMTALFYPSGGKPFFTPEFAFSFFILIVLGLSVAPHIINNVFAVKKTSHFRWSPLIIFALYFVVIGLLKLTGFAVRAMVAEGIIPALDKPDAAFIAGVKLVLPPYLMAFMGTIVLAAVMSTTDRLLLTIGNCVSWDFYKKRFRPDASDKQIKFVNKVTMVAATILTVVLAINPPKLLAILIWAGIGIMLSCFAIPLLGGLYWKRGTREGALASMLVGTAGAVGFALWDKFGSPLPVHFSLYSFGLALVTYIGVSYCTPRPSAEVLEATHTGLSLRRLS
jgi:sodium/proline symporter